MKVDFISIGYHFSLDHVVVLNSSKILHLVVKSGHLNQAAAMTTNVMSVKQSLLFFSSLFSKLCFYSLNKHFNWLPFIKVRNNFPSQKDFEGILLLPCFPLTPNIFDFWEENKNPKRRKDRKRYCNQFVCSWLFLLQNLSQNFQQTQINVPAISHSIGLWATSC